MKTKGFLASLHGVVGVTFATCPSGTLVPLGEKGILDLLEKECVYVGSLLLADFRTVPP